MPIEVWSDDGDDDDDDDDDDHDDDDGYTDHPTPSSDRDCRSARGKALKGLYWESNASYFNYQN